AAPEPATARPSESPPDGRRPEHRRLSALDATSEWLTRPGPAPPWNSMAPGRAGGQTEVSRPRRPPPGCARIRHGPRPRRRRPHRSEGWRTRVDDGRAVHRDVRPPAASPRAAPAHYDGTPLTDGPWPRRHQPDGTARGSG